MRFDGDHADGLDYSERAGFMVGRTAAIADWRHRKEREEFRAYCKRLYLKRWRLANRDKAAVYNRRWHTKPEIQARLRDRKRQARQRQDTTVHACAECRVEFCWYRASWVSGPRSEFCRSACYQRARRKGRLGR